MSDSLRRRRQSHPPVVILLLRALAGDRAIETDIGLDDAAAAWIAECGLGPILWNRVQQAPGRLSAQALQRLKAADLTARMLSEETFDVLAAVLARAGELDCPVTLLKGAGIAQQCYPQRHWRPMRDIDLLVDPNDQCRFEQSLREMGFCQRSPLPPAFFAGHHHSMPFHHAQSDCWIEVHIALFRPYGRFSHIPAFHPERLREERIRLAHESASVWRLSDELQLVYTAVHWGTKLQVVGGLVPVVDTLLLLKEAGGRLDWERVLMMCKDVTVARHLTLMLAYLERHGLYAVPAEVWKGLGHGRRSLGSLGTRILLSAMDDYLARGRPLDGFTSEAVLDIRWATLLDEGNAWLKLLRLPWRTFFPPSASGRYDPARHRLRLASLLRRVRR